MPERIVTVRSFRELWRREGAEGPEAAYEIECGSGTYVRSLIADLGDAYCLTLRRTAIGPFEVSDAIAPPLRGTSWAEDQQGAGWIPLDQALDRARQ
jgi:tRNA pseudouridine55 synthase